MTRMASQSVCGLALLLVVAGLVSSAPAHSREVYVDAVRGDDQTGSGSLDRPYRTFAKAVSTGLVLGDAVIAREGTYWETIRPTSSGEPGRPITFSNYGNERVIIKACRTVTTWKHHEGNVYKASVDFTANPKFTRPKAPRGNLGGLILQDGVKMNYAMAASIEEVRHEGEYYIDDRGSPPYVLYVNCRDLGKGRDPNDYLIEVAHLRWCIDLERKRNHLVFRGLVLYGAADNATHPIGCSDVTFSGLTLCHPYVTGIYPVSGSRHIVIEDCVAFDCGHAGVEILDSSDVIVRRCVFGDRNCGSMYIFGNSERCTVENNLLLTTGSGYGDWWGISVNCAGGSGGHVIRHNTIWDFSTFGVILVDGQNVAVQNNIVWSNRGRGCIMILPKAAKDGGHVIEFNCFYASDPSRCFSWNHELVGSLASWETLSGARDNLFADPRLTAIHEGDARLLPDSPCIDAAPEAGTDDSFYGTPRPVGEACDIGAVEIEADR